MNQNLLEVNTRVWIRKFDAPDKRADLSDIPDSFLENLQEKGFNFLWLMGIWKIPKSVIKKYCFTSDLIGGYRNALTDWKTEDVIGSPFSIDVYEVNPDLGDENSLLDLKSRLNKRGIKLILDFVPNHFSAMSSTIKEEKSLFLETDLERYRNDSHTYYKPFPDQDRYFAHGRDPFFPAWQDTIQVNYFSSEAREFMIKNLLHLAGLCDGLRCDMAMLALNNVFKNTWGAVLNREGYEKPKQEFWKIAIEIVKDFRTDFIFIAEAYWELEWELQQMGFDFTYDKKLTDRLETGKVLSIKEHLTADPEYQNKSLRFIENHDEERSFSKFGREKAKAAAIIISTILGLRFYYDGQFEGKKTKLPVQLGREPEEPRNECISDFYDRLFDITNQNVFKLGEWDNIETFPSSNQNSSFNNMLAWTWRYLGEKRLIVINYSNCVSSCRLKLDLRDYPEELEFKDLLNDLTYNRSTTEINEKGLYIELKGFNSHIFVY